MPDLNQSEMDAVLREVATLVSSVHGMSVDIEDGSPPIDGAALVLALVAHRIDGGPDAVREALGRVADICTSLDN